MDELTDQELLAELGFSTETKAARAHTAEEERVIAGFEDILKFVETQGRPPLHGEGRDIFERLYAVRLDRLSADERFRALLTPLDRYDLLTPSLPPPGFAEELDDADLLAELGIAEEAPDDITVLRNVRSREEINAAEEVASRTPCKDFEAFKPLFEQAQIELQSGSRETRQFGKDAGIATSDFFILGGQTAYVAETGEIIRAPNGESDARLRVIFNNGTESNLLRRSLQRALYKDEAGRRLTEPSAGPLFGRVAEEGDIESGTIYVLRSRSEHPFVAAHREVIHKIGVTGGRVEARIAKAALDPTYLLAEVDVIATYKLVGINRSKLEGLFHRVFAAGRLDLTIEDRFGRPVKPREWFYVPLSVIDEAVSRVSDGSISAYKYDRARLALVPV